MRAAPNNSAHAPDAPLNVCFIHLNARGAFIPRPGAKIGGAETQIRILADWLAAEANCRVTALVEDEGQPDVETAGAITLRRIPQPPPGGGLAGARRKAGSALSLLRVAAQSGANVFVQQCSGIETALTAWAARRAGAGFVYMMASDSELTPPWSRGGGLSPRAFRWGVRRADCVTAQHSGQLEGIPRVLGVAAERVIEVPNVFAFPAFHAAPRQGALWVGRARALKGPQHFLEVARRLPQFTFTLVALPTEAEPEFAAGLERQARALPNVEFYPGLTPQQLVPMYQQRAALLNTSDYEGMPNTFIEAAGHGLALAALRVDPGGMLSRGGAGLCAGGDLEKLVHFTRGLLTDEGGRARWAERAREFLIERHDLAKVGPQFAELLRQAARSHGWPR